MSEAPTYPINTIHDFATVPEDRLDDCLRDFRLFLRMMRPLSDLLGTQFVPAFTWVDDGEKNVRITIDGMEPEG